MVSRHAYLLKDNLSLIAIYDSLREGLVYHDKLKKAVKVGEFTTLPEFCLMDIGTEPILLKNFNLSVTMEVYKLTDTLLEELDIYYEYYYKDAYANINNRIEIDTPYGKAYVYVNNLVIKEGKVIASGDWKEYLEYRNIITTPKHKFKQLTN